MATTTKRTNQTSKQSTPKGRKVKRCRGCGGKKLTKNSPK